MSPLSFLLDNREEAIIICFISSNWLMIYSHVKWPSKTEGAELGVLVGSILQAICYGVFVAWLAWVNLFLVFSFSGFLFMLFMVVWGHRITKLEQRRIAESE
jgi:hypothetical protein